jgi:hypothetical protein
MAWSLREPFFLDPMLPFSDLKQRILAFATTHKALDKFLGDGLQQEVPVVALNGEARSRLNAQLIPQSGGNHNLAFGTDGCKDCFHMSYIIS